MGSAQGVHRHATRNAVRKRKRATPAVAAGFGAAPHLNLMKLFQKFPGLDGVQGLKLVNMW